MRYLFIIIIAFTTFQSCLMHTDNVRNTISEFNDKEIFFPNDLEYLVSEIPVNTCNHSYDFKIVTYIDSTDCTTCRLNLSMWNLFIEELKNYDDLNIEFAMIINTHEIEEISQAVSSYRFALPISIDSLGKFNALNKLPYSSSLHTFLLNHENRIILLGNPTFNHRIADLYRNYIASESTYKLSNDSLIECLNPIRSIGAVIPGDTIRTTFYIKNLDSKDHEIEQITLSCDCIKANMSTSKATPNDIIMLNVSFVPGAQESSINKYIDIYFKGLNDPIHLVLYGYLRKQ